MNLSKFVFVASVVASSQFFQNPSFAAMAPHKPGELVVKLKTDRTSAYHATAKVLSVLERQLGANSVIQVKSFVTDDAFKTIRMAKESDLPLAIQTLQSEGAVEFAEPNWIYRTMDGSLPNDPDFSKTWGLQNTGQTDAAGQVGTSGSDIRVVPLWQEGFKGSRKVLVAVIDTGIDWDHPDLKDNVYTNPGESGPGAVAGKDDDGNGFADDIHGWNFADNTANSKDDHRHGTHCSGTIGATGNNGLGVAGVNWEVSLLPVKFLDKDGGGSLQDAIDAINYARKMKVQIMSNSWGGGGYSKALQESIQATKDAGILFIAAAGNNGSNNDSSPTYPATYAIDNIVSVAATDNQDHLAKFSNSGARSVHVAAPGVKVYSTILAGKYDALSGTSMATPHVSGISALLLAAHPEWDYAEIKKRLIATSDPVSSLRTRVQAKGRVNAYNALHGIVPPSQDPDEASWVTVSKITESPHPYPENLDKKYVIQYPGAKMIRIHFERVETEAKFDKLLVQTPTGELLDELSGSYSNYTSQYVFGDSLVVRLKSDGVTGAYGFKVDKVQVILENP